MRYFNIKSILLLLSLSLIFMACSSDEKSFATKGQLEETIAEAQNLIETSAEGIEEGDYAPGSHKTLQARIDWAQGIISTGVTSEAFANARVILNEAIAVFKNNIVKAGIPIYGKGVFFDLGLLSKYEIDTNFTIECKVRFNGFGESDLGNIIAAGLGSAEVIIIRHNTEGIIESYIHNGDWVGGGAASHPAEIGKWYYLAFTFSGGKVTLYIDGEIALEVQGPEKPLGTKENYPLHIGANPSYAGRYMRGNVTNVSIWNYARNQAQVQNDMGGSIKGDEEGLLGYWPFDVNLGSSILDVTGKQTAKGTGITWEDK